MLQLAGSSWNSYPVHCAMELHRSAHCGAVKSSRSPWTEPHPGQSPAMWRVYMGPQRSGDNGGAGGGDGGGGDSGGDGGADGGVGSSGGEGGVDGDAKGGGGGDEVVVIAEEVEDGAAEGGDEGMPEELLDIVDAGVLPPPTMAAAAPKPTTTKTTRPMPMCRRWFGDSLASPLRGARSSASMVSGAVPWFGGSMKVLFWALINCLGLG